MTQYELERSFDVKCYYHLFYRCVHQYDIYKLLKNSIPDAYKKAFYIGYQNLISITGFDIDILLLNEYYLWLLNNDITELKVLFETRGSRLASIYLNSGFNLYESSIREEKYRFTQVDQQTKQFVNETFLPIIEKEKHSRQKSNDGNREGIFNSSTGEIVKSHDGTYYIDDFR